MGSLEQCKCGKWFDDWNDCGTCDRCSIASLESELAAVKAERDSANERAAGLAAALSRAGQRIEGEYGDRDAVIDIGDEIDQALSASGPEALYRYFLLRDFGASGGAGASMKDLDA